MRFAKARRGPGRAAAPAKPSVKDRRAYLFVNRKAFLTAAAYAVAGASDMPIATGQFNWVKRTSAWETVQAWRDHRHAVAQQFLNEAATAASSLVGAQHGLSDGMATLAAKAAVTRANAQINAARQQVAATVNLLA
jgi:hypothetical protein